MNFDLLKLTVGVLATIGLYSVLYKENKLYRFFEHVFVGLASGWALVALWTEVLKAQWWDKMVGTLPEDQSTGTMGYWPYMILLPIGLMGYFVFSKRHNWISRIPIAIILGLYSGQQFSAWQERYVSNIGNSMKPLFPTTFSSLFVPSSSGLPKEEAAKIASEVYLSQAISNWVFVVTLLSVLGYFLFSFDVKSKFISRLSLSGRWLLMIGFGAIFGSTVMMRFTLLIDRMFYVAREFPEAVLNAFARR